MWVVIIAVDDIFICEEDYKPNEDEERHCSGVDDEGEGGIMAADEPYLLHI